MVLFFGQLPFYEIFFKLFLDLAWKQKKRITLQTGIHKSSQRQKCWSTMMFLDATF